MPKVRIVHIDTNEAPLQTLQRIGGYYESPLDRSGKPKGPVVGYAGKDEQNRQKVGFVYANFAVAERYPIILEWYAAQLRKLLPPDLLGESAVFCGAPLGGLAFAYQLALLSNRRYAFAEKKVTKAAEEGRREESILIWGRHEVELSDDVVIVEDVCNNFSTTEELVCLIKGKGARVMAIVSLLNRSDDVEDYYHSRVGGSIPVISLVRKKIDQFLQDDPKVAEHIAAGNVIWKPKEHWDELELAMQNG